MNGKKMGGEALYQHVRATVIPDLEHIRAMKTAVAMPGKLSEPLVCHVMGWTWVRGNKNYDALDGEKTMQIKYVKSGYVSLKKDPWDYLAWIHAPRRLPKVLLLFPAAALARVLTSKGSIKFDTLRAAAKVSDGKAWRFRFKSPRDLDNQSSERFRIPVPCDLNLLFEISNDLERRQRARRGCSEGPRK